MNEFEYHEEDTQQPGGEATPPLPPPNSFEDMGLREELLRGLYSYGFERPSPVQQRCIAPLAEGRDLIVQAMSGTGKTASFSLGMLQGIDPLLNECQGLIVVPTRELAAGIGVMVRQLGDYMPGGGIRTHVMGFNGGFNRHKTHGTRAGQHSGTGGDDYAHVVVSTPGRMKDSIYRGFLITNHVKMVVFDEIDEQITRGFEEEIREIHHLMPFGTQTAVFSSTLPDECMELARRITHEPIIKKLTKRPLTFQGASQYFVNCEQEQWKYEVLRDIDNEMSPSAQIVIFCNTRARMDALAELLRNDHYRVSIATADLDSSERERALEEFRAGSSRFLLLTDLIIYRVLSQLPPDVNIINYDLPRNIEKYIQRVGRLGISRRRIVINFVLPHEIVELRHIERFYNIVIQELPADSSSW